MVSLYYIINSNEGEADSAQMTRKLPDIKYNAHGLVPAIAQEQGTGEVLMLAYMNPEALEKTLTTGRAHYWSRSRKKLWQKGETSENIQDVVSIKYDCDLDTLLLSVRQSGPACHTGEKTCFFRTINDGEDKGDAKETVAPGAAATGASPASSTGSSTGGASIITDLYDVILERKNEDPEKSYVAGLYSRGIQKIAAKIHEESAELIAAAKKEDKKEITHELCDLWFHTMVLLGKEDIPIEDVFTELRRRFGTSGLDEKASRGKGGK